MVLEACKRSHAWETALAFLERSNCRFPAMRACATASQWQGTLSLFVQMQAEPSVEARAASKSTILSALAKAMQWQRAIQLFNETEMIETPARAAKVTSMAQKGNSTETDWQIQNRSLLRVLGAAHLWRNALLHLYSVGAQEDAWSLSAAIWACQTAGQQTAAQELLSQHLARQPKRGRKELQLLEHLSKLTLSDGQILTAIEDFAKENRWLKVAGGEKGQILEAAIKPGDRVLEIGSYIGFTALRLALHGCDVVSIEADPLNAAVAQKIVEMGGGQVKICVGRATDWLSSGLDPVDVLLLDHRGTIYHEAGICACVMQHESIGL